LDVGGNPIDFIAQHHTDLGDDYQVIKEKLSPFFKYVVQHRCDDGFCSFESEDDSYEEMVWEMLNKLDAWMLYLIQDPTRDGPTLTISPNNPQA
jgi:hypothetical protein